MHIKKFYLGELVETHAPTLFVEFSDAGEVGWCPVNLETARQLAAQLNQAIARADAHIDANEAPYERCHVCYRKVIGVTQAHINFGVKAELGDVIHNWNFQPVCGL